MIESALPELIDFNDVRTDIDPAALEELVRSRLGTDGRRVNLPMADFNTLADDAQERVIKAQDEFIRVIGAPGTGKTQTLVNRILRRISAGARPERMLMLTFDSASAIVIREQIVASTAERAGPPARGRVTTLDACGYGLLRECFPAEHRPLAPAAARHRIVRNLLAQLRAQQPATSTLLSGNIGSAFYLSLIGLIKNAGFDPRSFNATELSRHLGAEPAIGVLFHPRQLAEHRREILKAIVWIFENYEAQLARSGNIDAEDQRLRALACLRSSPEVLGSIQTSLDEVIVDDFQDVSPLDFELIRALSGKARLIVAGDDDQATHRARGSSARYLIDFEEHCGRTVASFELATSYRCAGSVAAHAARLIGHDPERIPKAAASGRDAARISLLSAGTGAMEAKALATLIGRILEGTPGLSCSDIAVLYRSNAQIVPMQVEFVLKGIPYQVRSQDNIVESGDLAKLLSIVRLATQGEADGNCEPVDAWNCIRGFFRALPPDAEERIFNLCTGLASFEKIIRHPGMRSSLPEANLEDLWGTWKRMRGAPTLLNLLDVVAGKFQGMGATLGYLDDVVEGDVPLGEIFGMAAPYDGRPRDFVTRLDQALDRARSGHFGRNQDGVALLNYVRAKGRQWHTVIVAGASEGIIPCQKAPLEDERRLFYVTMTRASSNLIICCARNICRTPVPVSRFLTEAGLYDGA